MTDTVTSPAAPPPVTPEQLAAGRRTIVLREIRRRDPSSPVKLRAFTNRWPPRRCRLGWHRWLHLDVVGSSRRPATPPAAGRELCTLLAVCRDCEIVRHDQNVPVPRRLPDGSQP